MSLGFGNGTPDGVTTAWGARMITHGDQLDFVNDRQDATGEPYDRKALLVKLGQVKLIDAIREKYKEHYNTSFTDTLEDEQTFTHEGITVTFAARGGYCYVSAFEAD